MLGDDIIKACADSATVEIGFKPKYASTPRFDDESFCSYDAAYQLEILRAQIRSCSDYKLWLVLPGLSQARTRIDAADLDRLIMAFAARWHGADHPDWMASPVSNPGDQDMPNFSYSPVQTFAYNPLGGTLTLVQLSLTDAPAWNAAYSYQSGASVQRGTTFWIALMANAGIDPLGRDQRAWSPLVPMQMDMSPTVIPVGSIPPQPYFQPFPSPSPSPMPSCHGHAPLPPPHECPSQSTLRITSFEVLPKAIIVGNTGDNVFNFVWTLSAAPRKQTLYPGGTIIATNARTYSTTVNFTDATTFRLEVLGFGSTDYDTVEFRVPLVSPVYYGVSSSETLAANAVLALPTTFVEDLSLSRTVEPAGKYIYIAFPTRLGEAMVFVDGFHVTAWESSSLAITNTAGFEENYTILRSTYVQNSASVTLDVREES